MMSFENSRLSLAILTTSLGASAGGVSAVALEQANNLKDLTDLKIFCTNIDEVDYDGLPISSCHGHFGGRLLYFPTMAKNVVSANPQIIHQHGIWNYLSIVSTKSAKKIKCPLVISPHGMLDKWIMAQKPFQKRVLAHLFQNENFHNATVMHALTENEIEDIRGVGYKGYIALIPNGVSSYSKKIAATSREPIRIIYLGRLHEKKRVLELIESVQTLEPHFKELVRLDIYGWGDAKYTDMVVNKCCGCSVVNFHGPVQGELKSNAFENADLFVLPSQSEGLPMALLEAWSFGLPSLHTNECNLSVGFKCGSSFEIKQDVQSIQNGIKKFLSLSKIEVNAMRNRALSLAKNDFSWEVITQNYYALYNWLLDCDEQPDFVFKD